MKKYRFISMLIVSMCFCMLSNAQTTYKNVTIDRDPNDNMWVIVTNTNNFPVQINFEFKVGSKETAWQHYPYGEQIPAHAKNMRYACVGSKIYGLKLTYVDILQPSALEQIMDGIDAFATGYMDAKQKKQTVNNK